MWAGASSSNRLEERKDGFISSANPLARAITSAGADGIERSRQRMERKM